MNFLKLNNQIETILKISNNNFMNDSEECTYIYIYAYICIEIFF